MTAPAAPVKDPRWAMIQREPYGLLINGKIVQARSGATFDAVSPVDNEVIAKVALGDKADVDLAVAAARKAFEEGPWGKSSVADRAAALRRIKRVIEDHADELAFLEAVDAGKPIGGVHYSDIGISLESLDYFAGRLMELRGTATVMPTNEIIHHKMFDPLGVVAEILPWNGPLWTGVQRMAAILAAGNAAIMKPAQMASLTFGRLAQLLLEADLPVGVIGAVFGPGSTVGEALVAHPGVDMISLTGGVESGVRVLAQAAASVKKVSLELGSKSPNIIFADADFDSAAMWTVMGNFSNAGQICVSGSRALIQRPIYDRMIAEIKKRLEAMVVGDPLDPRTEMGSLISAGHAASVWKYIEIGKKEARLVTGGEPYTDSFRSKGAFIPPTLFADASPNATIAREEIFGPVLTCIPFDTMEEALDIANDSSYGLSSGVFTQDLDTAWKVSRGLMAGQVYVNQWFSPVLQEPSEGYKQSGYGGVGMEKYMQFKNVFFRLKP
jgi:acyl-CoA reductase-like NAD-dependent aldehyde dehydrogenase